MAVAAVTGGAVWLATRASESAPPRVSRLQVTPADAAALTISADYDNVAITPDGARLVYVGDGGRQLFVRALDALEPVSVFTGAPRGPFVSPDGQWIGFVDRGAVKKIPIAGGPAVTLAALDGPVPSGATWGPDDTIIFATTNPATGLQRVTAKGGPTTILDAGRWREGRSRSRWPGMAPGGQAALFTIRGVIGGVEATQVAVLNVQTGARTVLVRGGSHAHYVPNGYLVYATAGTLWACGIDPVRLEVRGTPVAVVRDVVTTDSGAVDAAIAANGTLAYVAGAA